MFSLALNINETFGVPTSAGPKGMMIDVDRILQTVFSKDGSMDKVKQYMLSSGAMSSTLEHAIPEALFSTPTNPVQGISAVKTINAANDQRIPIYVVNQSNINTTLPLLQLNPDVKTDIQNAVNAGKIVTVQKTNVTYNHWTGCGYIIIDPNTGAGSYMISDGLNGGGFEYWFWTVMLGLAWIALIAAVVLILPEIIAGLGAIAEGCGTLYLIAAVTSTEFIESTPYFKSFFSALSTWEYSPPPIPAPTTVGQGFWFFIQTRILFYYYSWKKYKDSSLVYWRFAKNFPSLTYKYFKEIIS
jgi:hypothetical protein